MKETNTQSGLITLELLRGAIREETRGVFREEIREIFREEFALGRKALVVEIAEQVTLRVREVVRDDTIEIVGQAIEEFARLMDVRFDKMEYRVKCLERLATKTGVVFA